MTDKKDGPVSIHERWAADEKSDTPLEVHTLPRWRRDKLAGYAGQEQPTMFDKPEPAPESKE